MHLFISQYLKVPPPTSVEQLEKDVNKGRDILSPLADLSNSTFGVRGHQQSVTCVAVTPDCRYLYTGSKEGHIFKWKLWNGELVRVLGKRPRVSESYRATVQRKAAAMTQGSSEGPSKRSGAARRRAMLTKKARGLARSRPGSEDEEQSWDSLLWPKLAEGQGHTDQLLALAISPDGKYLVSGGKDRRIGVWKIPATDLVVDGKSGKTEEWIKSLGGHKDTITSLRFRLSLQSPYELFSASFDRSVKLWAVDQGSYVETLFGHQDPVLDLDLLREETAVSAGGRDRSVRFWKVRNESQLVFRAGGLGKTSRGPKRGGIEADEFLVADNENEDNDGEKHHNAAQKDDLSSLAQELVAQRQAAAPVGTRDFYEGSVDCVAMVDGSHFLSGGDSGTIALWSTGKKKPVFTFPLAHGYDTVQSQDSSGSDSSKQTVYQPRWITTLATLPFGDLFASGSWDGRVRLWQLDRRLREFRPLYSLPAAGYVNALSLVAPPLPEGKEEPHPETLLGGRLSPTSWKRKGLGGKVPNHNKQEPQDRAESSSALEHEHGIAEAGAAQAGFPDSTTAVRPPQARTQKERQAPLLIIGLGKEPRLGRWEKKNTTQPPGLPAQNVRNGTLVIVLPLEQ